MNEIIGYKRNIKTHKYDSYTLKDIDHYVRMGDVTYRGLGVGKVSSDFQKNFGEGGVKIKFKGNEYLLKKSDFQKLGGIKSIKFAAPERRGY